MAFPSFLDERVGVGASAANDTNLNQAIVLSSESRMSGEVHPGMWFGSDRTPSSYYGTSLTVSKELPHCLASPVPETIMYLVGTGHTPRILTNSYGTGHAGCPPGKASIHQARSKGACLGSCMKGGELHPGQCVRLRLLNERMLQVHVHRRLLPMAASVPGVATCGGDNHALRLPHRFNAA